MRFRADNKGIATMKIREIPLDDLVLDQSLNLRDRLDDFTVERYADSWERLPPITVYKVDDQLLVADGFHRHAAAVMLGKRTIRAEIIEGSMTDALDFVASVNLFHGLPLTRAERRRAVEVKLKLHHDWSDRRMAEELAVSRELVAKIRRQLIESRQIPNLPGRVGADGKLYTSAGLPKDAGERLPKDRQTEQELETTERGRRGLSGAAPPPEPKGEAPGKAPTRVAERGAAIPLQEGGLAAALSAEVGAATIDEMLEVMSKHVMQLIAWTQAEGFLEAYKHASPNARGLFHTAAIKLAARADQLRRG
jgi:ParB-like chromosome segregation protein Spo0J